VEPSLTSIQLVRLLAEEDRRKVVAALVLMGGPATAPEIAERAELNLRVVVDALDRLASGRLVSQSADSFALEADAFQQAARAEAPTPAPSVHGDQPHDVARVLDTAFRDGKLVQWPAKRTKRLVVLDYLAQQFDIGKRYTEPEVNARLAPFNDDVATMRRYLVDEQFLDRSSGEYWRCGGSF